MNDTTVWIIIWFACAAVGGGITTAKGRGFTLGAVWGDLLGVIEVIITLCMKESRQAPKNSKAARSSALTAAAPSTSQGYGVPDS